MAINSLVLNASIFRSDFSEFTDKNRYPDGMINYWLGVADIMISATRWGRLRNLGVELFTAHNIVLEKMSMDTENVGGWPGLSKGVIASDGGGAVSVSYDTSSALEIGAGHWNLTFFGTRFKHYVLLFGAGPIHVGIGTDPYGGMNGPAWPGVVYGPWNGGY